MATVEKLFESKGLIIKYETDYEIEFTDNEGRTATFNEMGLFDFKVIDTFGLTSVEKALHWVVANAPALWDKMDNSYRFADFIRRSLMNLSNGHMDSITSYSSMADIVRSYTSHRLDYGLWTNILRQNEDFPGANSSSSNRFLLVQQEAELVSDGPREVRVVMDWRIRELRTSSEPFATSSGSDDKWTKKYNYSFRMGPDEYGFFRRTDRCKSSTLFFGMELECSTKLSLKEIQHIVTEVEPKQEPFFIGKDDGSVTGQYRENLVELVTVPCTPRYLRTNIKKFMDKVTKLAAMQGKEVKDFFDVSRTLNNGIHIHVSRDAFMTDSHRRKFNMVFHMKDKNSVKLFGDVSGRRDYLNHQYCHPSSNFEGRTLAYNVKNNADRLNDHYWVTSTRSSATTEVRLYQGIWDIEHVLTCIDFTEAVFDFTAEMPWSVMNWRFADTLKNFVLNSCKYRTFKKGLK